MQATLTLRDHAGTGSLDAYAAGQYIGQAFPWFNAYGVIVIARKEDGIVTVPRLSLAITVLEQAVADLAEEEPYSADYYDAEIENARQWARHEIEDNDREPAFTYHPCA